MRERERRGGGDRKIGKEAVLERGSRGRDER